METNKTFKSHIQGLRKSVGKTQREVFQPIGISNVCYKKYEYGQRIPNAIVAIKIANALETTVENIWGGKNMMLLCNNKK